ncbi:MAG: MFS transporter [Alphaproteobacteria bacterium]|nr:MFS transporter [Alphaproteobacteria bacterium]
MTVDAPAGRRPYLGPMVLLTLTQAMISWAVFAPPVIAKQALPAIGLDPIWIGAQPTIVFIAAMFTGMLASGWVARVNPMRATQLFVSFSMVGSILIATGSIPLVALGSAFVGAALGPATPASSHILARVTPVHLLPLVFSTRQTGVTLGGVMAGFITPVLMQIWDWQIAMLMVAGACAATLLLVEIWVRGYSVYADASVERRAKFLAPVRLVASIPALRWLALGAIPLVIAQYGLTTFLVLYLQEDIKLSVITAGWVLGAAQAAGGVGRILFGMIAGRYLPPLYVLLGLTVLAAIASILTATATEAWPLALIFLLGIVFGAGAAGWNGVFLAEAARLSPPGAISRVTGGMTFFIFGGIVFGPAGFALLIERTNFATAYIVTATLLAFSVFALIKTAALVKGKKA